MLTVQDHPFPSGSAEELLLNRMLAVLGESASHLSFVTAGALDAAVKASEGVPHADVSVVRTYLQQVCTDARQQARAAFVERL